MQAPNLTVTDVAKIAPSAKNISSPMTGGQKQVFPCEIDGKKVVLKFMKPAISAASSANNSAQEGSSQDDVETTDEVTARAQREWSIMEKANSPYLVRTGSVPLTRVDFDGTPLLYFSEELIDGTDLRTHLKSKGPLDNVAILRLASQITSAIKTLWEFAKIHRDIKPANIMIRTSGDFVLLDLGLAFDLLDDSLTQSGFIVGTPIYYSPEQLNFSVKRQMDFRSDLFSLGIVLYECATGKHPFISGAANSNQVLSNILSLIPERPIKVRPEISESVSALIMRLLNKPPHLRYRSCDLLLADIEKIGSEKDTK
jgi:serine/threonine-protein kinase